MADNTNNSEEKTLKSEVLSDNEGYKSLLPQGIKRLRELGKTDGDLAFIDKKYKYKSTDGKSFCNFANEDKMPDFTRYMNIMGWDSDKAKLLYSEMLRNCFPKDYYGSDNQDSDWLKIEFISKYNEALLEKSKLKNPTVPTYDDFIAYFKTQPYYVTQKIRNGKEVTIVGEYTARGLESLDAKYQQYLKDIWPEFWNGKIFNDRKAVTQDNIKENISKLCNYTYRDILIDTVETPGPIPIEEAHYFAIFCGNDVDKVLKDTSFNLTPYKQAVEKPMTVSDVLNLPLSILSNFPMPTNLSAAEGTIDKLIEEIEKLTKPSGGFPALLKHTLETLTMPLVAGIVWTRVRPYIALDNPNNIDPKQLSKDAANQMLQNFKKNTEQMIKDTTKEVKDTIDEIIITSKGLWDNIVSIPKTVSLMCSTAALPQTIPTTGGIPNPITVVLDVMNIIDSVLALFPPIIQDMLKILTLCKKLMIPLDKIPFLSQTIEIIVKIISALKKKKNEAMSVAKIHKAINKAEVKREKLDKRLQKLDKDNEKEKAEYDDISETIGKINENISMLENMCSCEQHTNITQNNEEQLDFYKQLEMITQQIDKLNDSDILIDTTIDTIIDDSKVLELQLGTIGANIIAGPAQMPIDTPIVASPLQSTNVTPYCGKVFV